MKKIKKIYLISLMMMIFSNLAYSALSISSGKITVETISTSEGENRVQYFNGVGNITISRTGNESAYLGIRLLENAGKNSTQRLEIGQNEYDLRIEGDNTMEILVNVTNISASVGTVQASGESPSPNQLVLRFPNDDSVKSSILSFNYSITVKSRVNTENRARIAFAIDAHKNFTSNSILAAEFIEVNLEDQGSLMGVSMGSMDFGQGVIFGTNRAVAPLKLEVKQQDKSPMNTLIQLDRKINLTPTSGIGDPIPVAITLDGNVIENSDGRYLVRDLTNGNPVSNLNVMGMTDIKVGQKSGEYKGEINIRITYTK